jgi:hypothetical protein
VLTDAGSSAVAIVTSDGPRLVHEVVTDTGLELRSAALDGSASTGLGLLDGNLRLQPAAGLAEAGIRLPTGWVVLAPDGRLPESGPNANTQIRRIPDGATVQLDEVAP